MKSDTLTVAAIVFVLGVIATGFGLTDWKSNTSIAPTELQRGFAVTE